MTPGDFRNLYLAYLGKAMPGAGFEVRGELEIAVTLPGGGSHSVYLENAYQQYRDDPGRRDEIAERYIESFRAVLNWEGKAVDPDRIVPVIKSRGWLDEIREGLEQRGEAADGMPEYVSDPYNSELAIFYAEDSELNIRYLTGETFGELGIDRERLRELAVTNLQRLIPEVEVAGGEGIYLLSAGGDYEASLILVDAIWDREALPVSGEFVVAVPSRDLLLVTGTGNGEAIERLRTLANEGAARLSYRLSPVLFVRRKGGFEVFEG